MEDNEYEKRFRTMDSNAVRIMLELVLLDIDRSKDKLVTCADEKEMFKLQGMISAMIKYEKKLSNILTVKS